MYKQLSKCEHFAHTIDLHRLPDIDASTTVINNKQHFVNVVITNFVFWTPAAAGPNCYFQKYYTSKILELKLMIT